MTTRETPQQDRAAPRTEAALENDIRELHGAKPGELARRLIERGWTGKAAAPPLDVERLAEALETDGHGLPDREWTPEDRKATRRWAAVIAAEYQRLTPPGDRDRREAELQEAIDTEIKRLWKIAYEYDQHGEGTIGLLVDMTNAIGGLDSLRALLAAPGQAGPRDAGETGT